MMEVEIQILMFIISFFFGILLYVLFNKFKKYFYVLNKGLNFINSTLFFSIVCILYFIITLKICFGKTNLYFIISVFFGYLISQKYFTKNM